MTRHDCLMFLPILLLVAHQAIGEQVKRFNADRVLAMKMYRKNEAAAVARMVPWEKSRMFRAGAYSTELTIYSVNNPRMARSVMRVMAAEPYGFAQFNLAKFAMFPPYEAVTRRDHLEPLRMEALSFAVNGRPFVNPWRADPKRHDRALAMPIDVLLTAANAYMRMGRFGAARSCYNKMLACILEIQDRTARQGWLDTAKFTRQGIDQHIAPQRELYPD